MSYTINADDPRTIKAVELAADAQFWLTGCTPEGEDIYGVPSQSEPGRYYIVTGSSCDCPDFQHQQPQPVEQRQCKHLLAVRLYDELVRAQQRLPAAVPLRRRRHLTVLT